MDFLRNGNPVCSAAVHSFLLHQRPVVKPALIRYLKWFIVIQQDAVSPIQHPVTVQISFTNFPDCYLPSSKKPTPPRQVRLSCSLPAGINIIRLIRPLTWPPLQQLPFPERRKAPAHNVRIHIHIHPVRLSWNGDLYNIL